MSVLRRIGPYLYSALHSYNSVWELLLLGSERQRADRDADRLQARFSFLAGYSQQAETIRRRLLPAYRAYTATISPDPIAISLELAVFLYVICEATNPSTLLDLGSGFSSYVFRSYAKSKDKFSAPVTYSVDDSTEWLDETRRFLQHHDCDCHNLWTWDEFVKHDRPSFDLVLQDMGDSGRGGGCSLRSSTCADPQECSSSTTCTCPVIDAPSPASWRRFDTPTTACGTSRGKD